ncbi:hypothetical protein TSA6c_00715 [Azospirillum sp. TSA6c]|nr:hypothetical protein TSA6c_00715 [Azospirillum sp. TSA6c]
MGEPAEVAEPGLRVVFHNPFAPDAVFAERELALRMLWAAQAKGWDAAVLHRAADIEAFDPDIVVSLHPQVTPKLTRHFTVACHWNPPSFYAGNRVAEQNERSYDGWLVASEELRRHVEELFWPTARPLLTAPIYPSAQTLPLEPRLSAGSQLFYIGSNWDGRRFPSLLSRLADAGVLALHGHPSRWSHMAAAFAGESPFDGRTVLEQANRCGLGLCLHLPPHVDAGIPNMRVFELAAAGALIVADRHPFIVQAFGDTVLYVDTASGEAGVAEQILGQVAWARAHPGEGRAMARAAQEIFRTRFSLDVLFDELPALASAGLTTARPAEARAGSSVDLVLPVRPDDWADAQARIEAVAAQQGSGPVGLVLVSSEEVPALERAVAARLGSVRTVRLSFGLPASAALWAGLRAARADWVGVLPVGSRPFPNHVATLLKAAEKLDAEAVYSGALQPMRAGEAPDWQQAEALPVPIGFSAIDLTNPATVAAGLHVATLLVRRERLRPILHRDPGLDDAWGAFLAHQIACRCGLGNSGLLTMRTNWRADRGVEAESARLGRLTALTMPSAKPCTDLEGGSTAPCPLTAPSDLDPDLAARLPRLVTAADFAALPGDRPIYVYGASRGGRIVQLEIAKWDHLAFAGFLDGMKNGECWGVPIARPESMGKVLRDARIIIASQYVSEIAKRLLALELVQPYNAYPFIALHLSP